MTNKAQEESSPTTTTTPTTTTSMQQPPPSASFSQKKIKVHLVAVGSAPILKKSKFLMNRTDNFGVAVSFLRKRLKLGDNNNNSNCGGSSSSTTAANVSTTTTTSSSSLFLYINSAFVPCPTEQIGDLYDCFGMREELVIHYSLQEAWG